MKPEIFADGFSNVTFRNGMIRMELGSLPAVDGPEGQSQLENHHRLVLTPQGFLQGLGLMQDLARRLAEAGVIRRGEGEDAAQAANGEGAAAAEAPKAD